MVSAFDVDRYWSRGDGRGCGRETWRARKGKERQGESGGGLAAGERRCKRIGLHVGQHERLIGVRGPVADEIHSGLGGSESALATGGEGCDPDGDL